MFVTNVDVCILFTTKIFLNHHIVFSATSTSPHFHRFLLNKAAKIGENGGSRDNHASNACKNQGVAQD